MLPPSTCVLSPRGGVPEHVLAMVSAERAMSTVIHNHALVLLSIRPLQAKSYSSYIIQLGQSQAWTLKERLAGSWRGWAVTLAHEIRAVLIRETNGSQMPIAVDLRQMLEKPLDALLVT